MINSREEEMRVRYASLAGFMYLFVFALFFGGDYIVTHIRGEGSFSEITNRIIQSQNLYRLGLSMDVAEALCTVLMALGLYVVVKPVDRNLALLAFTFRMAEVISGSSQVITRFTALQLRLGADYTKSFDAINCLLSWHHNRTRIPRRSSCQQSFLEQVRLSFFICSSSRDTYPK